ncbi:hypothetical protein [Acinetobacter piscicola]|uniref:hypothetical protein n=1 Tax=Acinetobacter piscicola TaxID=2006115 RepID=UPI000B7CD460|nr:hypothetical protein [Acinetobacter piscicola]
MRIDQRNNSKLMWIIAGALIVVSLFITVFFWLNNDHKNNQVNDQFNQPVAAQKKPVVAAPPAAQPIQENAASTANVELVNASILKDQVPQNASLAKEEFAKLEDIQKQLNEQQQNLKSQQADADQLIKLKEEQVKLLEQQLAIQAKA